MEKEKKDKVREQITVLRKFAEDYPIPWRAICELCEIESDPSTPTTDDSRKELQEIKTLFKSLVFPKPKKDIDLAVLEKLFSKAVWNTTINSVGKPKKPVTKLRQKPDTEKPSALFKVSPKELERQYELFEGLKKLAEKRAETAVQDFSIQSGKIEQLRRNIENCISCYKTFTNTTDTSYTTYDKTDEGDYGILGNLQYYIDALRKETGKILGGSDKPIEPCKRRITKLYRVPRNKFEKKVLSDLFKEIESERVNVEYMKMHPSLFDSIKYCLTSDDGITHCGNHLGHFWGAQVITDPICEKNTIEVISAEIN